MFHVLQWFIIKYRFVKLQLHTYYIDFCNKMYKISDFEFVSGNLIKICNLPTSYKYIGGSCIYRHTTDGVILTYSRHTRKYSNAMLYLIKILITR